MLHSNARYPGWVQGWTVYKVRRWLRTKFVGVYETRAEAEQAARRAGSGYEVRWGSYAKRNRDFVTGDRFATI